MRGEAGPVGDQPDRPRTPPGVGTPLRAGALVGATRLKRTISGALGEGAPEIRTVC